MMMMIALIIILMRAIMALTLMAGKRMEFRGRRKSREWRTKRNPDHRRKSSHRYFSVKDGGGTDEEKIWYVISYV